MIEAIRNLYDYEDGDISVSYDYEVSRVYYRDDLVAVVGDTTTEYFPSDVEDNMATVLDIMCAIVVLSTPAIILN